MTEYLDPSLHDKTIHLATHYAWSGYFEDVAALRQILLVSGCRDAICDSDPKKVFSCFERLTQTGMVASSLSRDLQTVHDAGKSESVNPGRALQRVQELLGTVGGSIAEEEIQSWGLSGRDYQLAVAVIGLCLKLEEQLTAISKNRDSSLQSGNATPTAESYQRGNSAHCTRGETLENQISTVNASPDWLSPSDKEAPTMESIGGGRKRPRDSCQASSLRERVQRWHAEDLKRGKGKAAPTDPEVAQRDSGSSP